MIMDDRAAAGGRRALDLRIRVSFFFVCAIMVCDFGLHVWTFRALQGAIRNAATNRAELYRRLDVSNQNDDALADQLSLLRKELKLTQQQVELQGKQQRSWVDALERPVKDRAKQK